MPLMCLRPFVDYDVVLAKVHLHGSRAEAGKGYQIVVIGIISLIGDGKGVIINELHALEVNRIALALIGLEFIEAFNSPSISVFCALVVFVLSVIIFKLLRNRPPSA